MSKPKHHVRQEVCSTRAPYRDGRKPTAVKVYTIHHESKYVLVQGVPAVGAKDQLINLFENHGDIEEHRILDDYPAEQFTEVYLIKYKRIQSARFAKKKLDDWSFYGGVLHVCYAPEYETVQETREKLADRRRVIEAKSRQYKTDGTYSNITSAVILERDTDARLIQNYTSNTHNSSSSQVLGSVDVADHYVADTEQFTQNSQQSEVPPVRTSEHSVIHEAFLANFSAEKPVASIQELTNQSTSYSDSTSLRVPPIHNSPIDTEGNGMNQFMSNVPPRERFNQQYGYQNVPPNTGPVYGHQVPGQLTGGQSSHQYGGQSGPSNPLKSYGQQVVQQAQSLQNYGQYNNKAKSENTGSNKRQHGMEHDGQETDNSGTQNVTGSAEEQLVLPPPPKQTKTSNFVFRNSQKYGGRKVPSAQATFPAGFDARTVKQHNHSEESKASVQTPDHTNAFQKSLSEIKWEEKHVEQKLEKTMQEKVEENLKSANPVIKSFNKQTAPRFIPRQAQIKKKSQTKSSQQLSTETPDELSKEIRKNALTLGRPQGPADLGTSLPNELLDPKEKSVMDSVLQIRKKMTQI